MKKILETKKFISELNNIETENIEIIATTQTPIFKTAGKRMTHLDKFILQEKRIPNLNEIQLLQKKYYQLMKSDQLYYQFNNEIKSWNTKYNVKILDKSKYICDHKRETCSVLTNNNYKIYWDSNHYTLEGIKYLSKNEYFRSFFNK